MTDQNYAQITAVLDRSGSMTTIRADMEGGFDAFVESQRIVPGKCDLTLVQFDTVYEVVYASKPIADVPPLKLVPRGATALLDALGRAITETGEQLAAKEEDERPGKVIFVIITDGLENSSQEFNRHDINAMVTRQIDQYGWTFVYLGANQDAIAVASSIGIPKHSTMTYDTAHVGAAYGSTQAVVTNTRAGRSAGFTEADREAADPKEKSTK
jgi:hypothetical protein